MGKRGSIILFYYQYGFLQNGCKIQLIKACTVGRFIFTCYI